jgi:threonine dehydrogenase-like Zn-dependent dehydrogenase
MQGVTFTFSIPRYLLGRALGGLSDAAVFGRPSAVGLTERPAPRLPGDRWVSLDVIAGGICGTDVGNLLYTASPILEPFASFPAVLGHEILGRVVEAGSAVTRVRPGQRVAVDPIISCAAREYPEGEWCPSCRAGHPGTCARGGEEGALRIDRRPLARGISIGYHDDQTAALIEPLAVATHGVLWSRARPGDAVLVIGSGPIALAAIWALRALGHDGDLLAQVKRPHEAELARRLGASAVVTPGEAAREAMVGTGATAYRPPIGPEVYAGGGFDVVFDCVGSRRSLDQALRFAAPCGRIAMLGCAAVVRRLDLTLVWARALAVQGTVGYGMERWEDETLHTYEVVQRLLVATKAPVADVVTHTYPLTQYRTALSTARHRGKSSAVKVLLTPR